MRNSLLGYIIPKRKKKGWTSSTRKKLFGKFSGKGKNMSYSKSFGWHDK